MKRMGKLEGKIAVITGGASGIGEAAVRLFVDEGARVVIADILDEAGSSLADSLGSRAVFKHADVTSECDVKTAVELAVSRFGGLDIMFNNAGAMVARGSILEVSAEAFDGALTLLVRSVFLGMKHAGAILAKQGSGSILSTASIAGLLPGAGPHIYSTAKAAVIHLTKCVALELGESGVRVNCICPGGVPTQLVLDALGAGPEALEVIKETMTLTQPLARAGLPEDIARAALWLCSEDASYVTGQAVAVDGGAATGIMWSKQALK
jgi:NAD(P)-dependent dehydrogenase (short-subunit alcohol dehydrogenase family)